MFVLQIVNFVIFSDPLGMTKVTSLLWMNIVQKIKELFEFGGDQLLLQGGHHPSLGLSYYTELFRKLKEEFPKSKTACFGSS